jgi:hypothetical protein
VMLATGKDSICTGKVVGSIRADCDEMRSSGEVSSRAHCQSEVD